MNKTVNSYDSANQIRPLFEVLYAEIYLWLPFAVLVFFIASILMSGWPGGLIPNIRYPFSYNGDGISHTWMIQRVIEGVWYFDNARSGYPFGSNFLDYPSSDTGNFLVLKMLGALTGSFSAAMNIYFLLGFSVTFAFSYAVLRTLQISRSFTVACAVVFVFLPFHFFRLVHLFYTWYFVVPLFFYYGYRLFVTESFFSVAEGKWKAISIHSIILLMLSSFGVYYALFGVFVLIVGAIAGTIRNKSKKNLFFGFAASAIIALGVLVNVSPSIYNNIVRGANLEVANRSVAESEIYGLKITQMLLPRPGHRLPLLVKVAASYNDRFPLNENSTSSLGLIGAIGLLIIFSTAFMGLAGRQLDSRLAFLGITAIVLIFIATVGGFASLFALFVSPLIRGWNRVSVFIGFAAIAAFFMSAELYLKKYLSKVRLAMAILLLAISTSLFGIWDQTTPACTSCNETVHAKFVSDREFVKRIEAALPKGSAVYQLPYMPFPEVPPLHRLGAYDLAIGFLHSEALRWSYAGMRGREGDLFFRALAQQDMKKQLEVIGNLGFAGIYIDRRGFVDGGKLVEDDLHRLLGREEKLISGDGQLAFYRIGPAAPVLAPGATPHEIMKQAGFFADKYGVRYQAAFEEGIDFRRKDLPIFVNELRGLSVSEPWGRWSDGNLSRSIVLEFSEALPRSFTLSLRGQAFGPNSGKSVHIRVGRRTESVQFSSVMEVMRVRFEIEHDEKIIEIIPPLPTTPKSLGINDDTRKLGIGLERIWIE